MKIAFIVSEFPKLSETFILKQITGLLDLGHHVEIFARLDPKEEKRQADIERYGLMGRTHYYMPRNGVVCILKTLFLLIVNFHKGPIRILRSLYIFGYGQGAWSLRFFYILIFFLNKKFDIIHCHFGPNGILGAFLRKMGVPGKCVTSFYGYDISGFVTAKGNGVYKDLFSRCDLCLSVCDCFRTRLIGLGCDEDKAKVLRVGVDLQKLRFSDKRINAAEGIKIITVGRMCEKKGYEYAIRAMAKSVKRHRNILYTIVGDGPLRGALESLVCELDIKDHVEFLGIIRQEEILGLLAKSHIFVLSSVTASDGDLEGTPVVLLEAQAAGLPVVSTYHSGIPEIVVDGKSGFLVPEKDTDALADRINYLVENPQIWTEMGAAGRRFIEENFDIKKLNEMLIEDYKSLFRR
ncbi:MAG: hypothetical protein A2Z72_08675 [Omnitrophica bacterium RBG_13_46_9]|nr:MAG: hypothetical protein A2Z72_08675 [Omnitrophica bacterium RBG_13_46_9]